MKIGKNAQKNENVEIDLQRLISTRLLIQANSGGGKSWLIRRLLEQSHGKFQQIVIDLEGEFSTLREKFDYLLVGKDGEIPANIQTADLLARKLLKLNVSTIIDLSELKKAERITFVKRFLDSLIDSPRELWHSCLVIVDEAHQFCPEKTKSESAEAVKDLLTRGRKRGFCGVLATQRIAKLNKDAAAECTNGFVGRTVMDIDRKRASYDLGFTTKEQELSLKKMDDGEFFGYGPAISKEDYVRVMIGGVMTKHPEPGRSIIKSSKTPDNIKKLLKDVIDLPKEVEAELKTKKDFQNKINELKRELIITKQSQPKPIADEKTLERVRQQGFKEAEKDMMKEINFLRKENNNLIGLMNKIGDLLKVKVVPRQEYSFKQKTLINKEPIKVNYTKESIQEVSKKYPISNKIDEEDGEVKLKSGAIRMLNFIAMFKEITRAKVKTLSGISSQGTFSTYVQDLKRARFIEINGNILKITEEGINYIGDVKPMPTDTESLIELWSKHIKSGAIRMLRICIRNYPYTITRSDLKEESEISSQGTFSTYVQDLKRNNLIKVNGQEITASEELFE